MSEQPPNPDTPDNAGNDPYGNPPPPPTSNPYAAPPQYFPPPQSAAEPPPPAHYPAPTYAATPGHLVQQPGAGGLAITALVLAIVALVLCWVPVLGPVLALVGLVLGIIAWSTAGKNGRPKGVAIGATIVGAVAMLAAIAFSLVWIFLGDVIVNCSDPNLTQDQVDQCVNDQFGIDSQ